MVKKKVWSWERFLWVGGALLLTVAMTVGLIQLIRDEEPADYIVETNAFFAPFEFYKGREIKGVDVEIIDRVAKKLNKKIEIQDVEFDVIIDNVAAGKIADAGAAGLTITPARLEKVNFSKPYYTSVQYVIYRKGAEPAMRNGHVVWDTLAGKVLGSQTGGTGYLFTSEEIEAGLLKDTGARIKGFDSHQLAADAINAHIIDYAIADEVAARFIVEKNPSLASLPLYYAGETAKTDRPVEESYAIAVNKDRTELLTAFDEVLDEMMKPDENGQSEIEKLVIKYMGL